MAFGVHVPVMSIFVIKLLCEKKLQVVLNYDWRKQQIWQAVESTWPIFKTEMLVYQSKTNANVNTLFGKVTHYLDPEICKI